jgi:hypothetical protein
VHFSFEPVETGPGKATKIVGVAIEDYQHHQGTRSIAVVTNLDRDTRVSIFDGVHQIKFPSSAAEPTSKTFVLSSGVTITVIGKPGDRHFELVIKIETPSGLRVKIVEKAGVLFPSLEADDRYKNGRSIGLLGYFDGNPLNDLTPSARSTLPCNNCCDPTLNEAFDFGESWKIDDTAASLFRDAKGFAVYTGCYLPNIAPPEVSQAAKRDAQRVCGLIIDPVIRAGCEFDVLVTASTDVYRDAAQRVEEEMTALQIRTNRLPTIDSGLYVANVDTGNGYTFTYSVADAETPVVSMLVVGFDAGEAKGFCDGSSLFAHTYNRLAGTGRIDFFGTVKECKYAAWVTVSDGWNTVLTSFVVNVRPAAVIRRTVTPVKECANNLRAQCRCAGRRLKKNRFAKVLSCVQQRIHSRCVAPLKQPARGAYVQNVARWVNSFGTQGCPP